MLIVDVDMRLPRGVGARMLTHERKHPTRQMGEGFNTKMLTEYVSV